jgi:hypothetical protein
MTAARNSYSTTAIAPNTAAHPGDARRHGQRSTLHRDGGRLRCHELLHSRASVIVHDHLETPSAITLKPASTIVEMRNVQC